MKPSSFEYRRAESLENALDLLAASDGDIKPLAGGQSLVALMNLRLARPVTLVDIAPLAELGGVRSANGGLTVGALTTLTELEHDAMVAERSPLLAEALPYVGHPAIRNRGTAGGSIAHADPAAELPVVLAALNGTVTLRSRNGERTVPAREFFLSFLMTVAEPNELVTAITLPDVRDGGAAFEEFARRPGDFALVSVACVVSGGQATVALGGVSGAPVVVGPTPVDSEASAESARALAAQAAESISPPSDVHGSREYRQHLTRELVGRAMRRATAGRS
jgi:CO/xanthine dehydrogenase FAD-binding subunit